MISFKEFSPDDRVLLAEEILALMPEADTEDVESVICTCVNMLEEDPDLAGHPLLKRAVEKMYVGAGNILN